MRRRPPLLLWLLGFLFLRSIFGHRHHHRWAPYGRGLGGRHYV